MVKKRLKKLRQKNLKLFILVIVVMLLIFIGLGIKLGLYFNFLLGNDIIVNIDVSKDKFYLTNGEAEDFRFTAKVRTNPFCKAECELNFIDISHNDLISEEKFILTPTDPFKKEYQISSTTSGTGQDLFSFRVNCLSKSSFLCHTDEKPSQRNLIITLDRELNENEINERMWQKEELNSFKGNLEESLGKYNVMENVSRQLKDIANITFDISELNQSLIEGQESLENLYNFWMDQDVGLSYELELASFLDFSVEENELIGGIIGDYNSAVSKFEEGYDFLNILMDIFLTQEHSDYVEDINSRINEFNQGLEDFSLANGLNAKKSVGSSIFQQINSTYFEIINGVDKTALEREINVDVDYDILCELGYCYEHPNIDSRSEENISNLNSCDYFNELKSRSFHISLLLDVNLSKPVEFWNDMDIIINNKKRNIIQGYLDNIDVSSKNYELIEGILQILPAIPENSYEDINDELIYTLIGQQDVECVELGAEFNDLNIVELDKILIPEVENVEMDLVFDEPNLKCCVFDECHDCCVEGVCKMDYPVLFVHGHAMNKGVSAEYSLAAFDDLQQELEAFGYLNAGSINMYYDKGTDDKKFNLIPVPLTFKVSYYFDIFQQSGDHQIVQTKSENIDTYAIRLKEIIDNIKIETGKKKVIIVAHSMGGLVSRRYLQIFGDGNVEKAILIATPNHGISGNTARYCSILGEGLECRDMKAESLFMNKLSSGIIPEIPIYTIIGVGCDMVGRDGDGVVLRDEVMLDWTKNYIIEGSCSSTSFLHTQLLDVGLYPSVYEIIERILKENSQIGRIERKR